MKRAKTGALQVKSLLELKHYCLPRLMPPSANQLLVSTANMTVTTVDGKEVYYIPLDDVYHVEGACLTGKQQVRWMQQLIEMPGRFVLHADGKHKLHHGDWILITVGTHHLRWDAHHNTLSTQFVPLVYLMCKQHESDGACRMLLDGLNSTCIKYFGKKLEPGATMSDHSAGFRNAYEHAFPGVQFGQCWPHIARKCSNISHDLLTYSQMYKCANVQMGRGRVREQDMGEV